MNLHEYQGKSILRQYGVSVPEGVVIENVSEALDAAKKVQEKTKCDVWAVKAQIHAGGRGKGGGVKIAKSLEEVQKYAEAIVGMNLVTPQTGAKGKKVHKVLIEQGVYYKGPTEPKEFYMSVLMNRNVGRNMIMYSTAGGMSIEEVAAKTPELIFKEEVDPKVGLMPFQCRRIAFNLGLNGNAFKEM